MRFVRRGDFVDVLRWYITGGAGSGKTTLAEALSGRLGIPHYDIDRGEAPSRTEEPWIVEGAHIWDMSKYVLAADEVIWLDLPLRVTVPRILLRHVRLSIKGTNRHPGIRNLVRFVAGQPEYYRRGAREPTGPTDWDALSRAATHRLLQQRREGIVILRTPREVKQWRRKVGL